MHYEIDSIVYPLYYSLCNRLIRLSKVIKSLRENPYIFTFYGFPKPIWRSIYSKNLIESFNKQIKKYTKCKEQFPHEEALEKFLVSQFESYNQRFATRCHFGFDQACAKQGGRPARDNRTMLNAMLWIARTGAPWRDLSEYYGSWKTLYTRCRRWQMSGVWELIL